MGVNWTAEQQQVINLRDRNILVSAAAGSGKTAVLVERIITMLTRDENPVDVDQLLIVTFTEAAASEMKERIRTAIEKKLEAEPGNAHLERQETLIHNAMITTIHSFCLSVIRDHFHAIDIDPGFRIAEEGELKLLKQDVLSEVLEEKYESQSRRFLDFVDAYGTGRSDKKIEEMILKIYELGRSYPDQTEWLHSLAEAYRAEDLADMERSEYIHRIISLSRRRLEDAGHLLEQGLQLCGSQDGPKAYETTLNLDLDIVKNCLKADTFAALSEVLGNVSWSRLVVNKDKSVSEEKIAVVKMIRDAVKLTVNDLAASYFYQTPEVWLEEMHRCLPAVEELIDLVELFGNRFEEKKRTQNMIDFSDMEQFALRILTKKSEDGFVPSDVAKEYQQQFREIMIDEYQDSNLIQETILTSVSTVWEGHYNIFMVGDVKQSIYSFRLSRPELFMEKFDRYSVEDSKEQRVDLHKNFRSRAEVLESVNFIFRQIMTKGLGGVGYDEKAALYVGASYPEGENLDTEVLVIDGEGTSELEWEARMIAGKIRELMSCGQVVDKQTGQMRPIRYSDIVILARSMGGVSEVFTKVLSREGIPVYVGTKEGYFATQEIGTLLDYLRVLDNRRQDIPLTAVLTSPFGGFVEEELAEIRSSYKGGSFYKAIEKYRQEGSEQSIREKLEQVLGQMDRFREIVPYTSMHDLLRKILRDTGYGRFIAAMPGGAQRQANVEMLIEQARVFEASSYKGLFHFVRYMEQLQKYDVDYGEANLEDEQSDTVRIMTIHKSKGLEFPVVFVSEMGKQFNLMDARGAMVLHPSLGLGLDVVNLEQRTKTPSLIKKVIQKEEVLDALGEELRVLYVALTRAKEKLIMTGICKNLGKKLDASRMQGNQKEETLSFSTLSSAMCYLDWVLPALMRLTPEVPMRLTCVSQEDIALEEVAEEMAGRISEEVLRIWDTECVYDPAVKQVIEEQFGYEYPYGQSRAQKLKFTVSELKKRAWPTGEEQATEAGEELMEEPEVVPLIPRFLQEEEVLSGAPRGTAYHRVMELMDFSAFDLQLNKERMEESLREQLMTFTADGKMSQEMADCVRMSDLCRLLESNVGRRVIKSAAEGKLYREQPFVIGVDAREIYPQDTEEELILIQGIIDAYFEEPDGLTVVDYKTDRVYRAEELIEKYHVQLDYYARALTQITGKPVKEKMIYSFTLGKEIRL